MKRKTIKYRVPKSETSMSDDVEEHSFVPRWSQCCPIHQKGKNIGLVMSHAINVELGDDEHCIADGTGWPQLVAF